MAAPYIGGLMNVHHEYRKVCVPQNLFNCILFKFHFSTLMPNFKIQSCCEISELKLNRMNW